MERELMSFGNSPVYLVQSRFKGPCSEKVRPLERTANNVHNDHSFLKKKINYLSIMTLVHIIPVALVFPQHLHGTEAAGTCFDSQTEVQLRFEALDQGSATGHFTCPP
ncbi:hypothetical protein ILYODFUR_003888 [Ilyodon furcidens]|uniref:Uncharacterized protein n=1 Tax=Ilyodon furcidens TaxID=33524 RepID=A0ABV0V1S9_9TELE